MTETQPNPEPSPRSLPRQSGTPSSATAGRPGSTLAEVGAEVHRLVDQCLFLKRVTHRVPSETLDLLLDTVAKFDDLAGDSPMSGGKGEE